jgi:hypothetical protein
VRQQEGGATLLGEQLELYALWRAVADQGGHAKVRRGPRCCQEGCAEASLGSMGNSRLHTAWHGNLGHWHCAHPVKRAVCLGMPDCRSHSFMGASDAHHWPSGCEECQQSAMPWDAQVTEQKGWAGIGRQLAR